MTGASSGSHSRTRALTPPSFVTAPALQTVHALGHGLATALALFEKRDQETTQDDIQDNEQNSTQGNKDMRKCERTPKILSISIPDTASTTCAQSNLTPPVKCASQNDVMEMINAYARAAVQLAQQTWKQRRNHDSTSQNNNNKDFDSKEQRETTPDGQSIESNRIKRKQSELDDILYDVNDEVVREWKSFLLRI